MITETDAQQANALCRAIEQGDPIEPAPAPQTTANPILDALDLLHRTYPGERVDIWCSYRENGELRFTAMVESFTPPDDTKWSNSWMQSPQAAAANLIERAGSRSKADRLAKRLEALRKELAELEAQKASAA